MARIYAKEEAAYRGPKHGMIDAAQDSKLIVVERTWDLASQATTDDLGMVLPAGFSPRALILTPSATLGSSTLAIGNATSASKYRAAATLTGPVRIELPEAAMTKLTAAEEVIIAIAAAALPSSGTLRVRFEGIDG